MIVLTGGGRRRRERSVAFARVADRGVGTWPPTGRCRPGGLGADRRLTRAWLGAAGPDAEARQVMADIVEGDDRCDGDHRLRRAPDWLRLAPWCCDW